MCRVYAICEESERQKDPNMFIEIMFSSSQALTHSVPHSPAVSSRVLGRRWRLKVVPQTTLHTHIQNSSSVERFPFNVLVCRTLYVGHQRFNSGRNAAGSLPLFRESD